MATEHTMWTTYDGASYATEQEALVHETAKNTELAAWVNVTLGAYIDQDDHAAAGRALFDSYGDLMKLCRSR